MRPLSLFFICLLFGSLNLRPQSTYAQVSKVEADAKILRLVKDINEQLSAMWLRQPGALLAKTINHPVQLSYSINSVSTLTKYNLLKSSNFTDVDLEALRVVSNIPVLANSHFEPMCAYSLGSTFSNDCVETEFIRFDDDPSYFCGGDTGLPGMLQRRSQPDFPINETKNKEADKAKEPI